MSRTRSREEGSATPATGRRRRRSPPSTDRWRLGRRGTATGALSRRSSESASGVLRVRREDPGAVLAWALDPGYRGALAARKLIYLAITDAVPQWTRTRGWTKALLAFKIH